MPRSRRRSRRNPVKLSTTEKVVAGVASVAALGALTYVLVGKSAAAAGPGAPGSSCWQPVASPFTLVPGTYRLAMAIPAAQQASLQTQWTQLGSQLAALQTALPSLRVTGVWAEGLAYPSGTPFPAIGRAAARGPTPYASSCPPGTRRRAPRTPRRRYLQACQSGRARRGPCLRPRRCLRTSPRC